MKIGSACKLAAALVACSAAFAANADMLWDEGVDGDFSNDGLAPTAVTMGLGSNTILGTTGNAGAGIDRDYFTFVVPDGSRLTALRLLQSTTVSGSVSFLGLQAGPQLTVTPTGGGAENLLGFAHYGSDLIGTDLLPALVFGNVGGLPSGTYSAWVQETGGPVSYGFDFQITPVPLPGAALLLFSGLFGLSGLRRRRQAAAI